MFPYNKAANRNIRRSKRNDEIEENISAGPIMEGSEDSDVLWDFTEYKLTYVLDNFQMPQIVRVVEGFMFTEDDSLASGTILTIHGQQKIERICAVDRNGEGEDIFIPLSCPYKVKVTVPDRERIYRSVKDLCNATPLPKCVIVHEKISAGGVKIPSGRMLIVKSISKSREGQAEGVLVELLDSSIRNLVLPLKVIGNFAPCPLPSDQNRTYFVRELSERLFPLWVTFRSSFEKSPPYGPHMGVVKLQKLETTDVVFSTSIIDGKRFAISFSRDLPVTVEMARNATHDTSTISNKLRQTEEQVDIGVLAYLADTNPYSDKYQSAIYADVCALRKAFEQRGIIERARDSSDSFQSDASCSEERLSSNSHRYILDRAFSKGRSRNSSLGGDSQSIDSQSNHSADSSNELQPPLYTYVKHQSNFKAIEKVNQSDSDLEDEEGYTLIAEQMDYPYTSRKQNRTKGSGLVQPYECTEIRTSSPTQRKPDWNFSPPPNRAESPPIAPVRKKKLKSGSASSVQSGGEPYSSKVSLNRSSSDDLSWQGSTLPTLNCHIPETVPPSLETLTLSHGTLPSGHGTLLTGHGTLPSSHGTLLSGHKTLPLSGDSELSDTESVASDYHSVKSEPGFIAGPGREESSSNRKARKSYENVELDITKESKEDGSVDLHREEFLLGRKAATSSDNVEPRSLKGSQKDCSTDYGNERTEKEVDREEKYIRKFSVTDAGEDEVCKLLDEIQLSDFKEIFKEEQINGSLLEGLDIETLNDLGLNRFQAVKLMEYVKGWRQDEECTNESNDPNEWTTDNVQQRMQQINLKKLAEFCAENQVDGKLLQSLIDNDVLECLTKTYSVGLTKFNANKLIRYVKKGWRPDK